MDLDGLWTQYALKRALKGVWSSGSEYSPQAFLSFVTNDHISRNLGCLLEGGILEGSFQFVEPMLGDGQRLAAIMLDTPQCATLNKSAARDCQPQSGRHGLLQKGVFKKSKNKGTAKLTALAVQRYVLSC